MDEYSKESPPEREDEKEAAAPLIKGGWLRAVLILLSFILVQGLFGMIGMAVVHLLTGLPIDSLSRIIERGQIPGLLAVFQAILLVGTLLLVFAFRKGVDRRSIASLGLSFRPRPLLLGLLLGPLMMGACALILYLTGHLDMEWRGMDPMLLGAHLLLVLTIAVNEEFLVRGYVLTNLMESIRPWAALFLSALVFMLLHVFNPHISAISVLNLFFAGLLLGVTYIRDRQLAFPIGLHLSWNFAQGHLFGFSVSGMNLQKNSMFRTWTEGPSYLTGSDFGLEGSVILLGLQVLLIPSIYWLWKKRQ